ITMTIAFTKVLSVTGTPLLALNSGGSAQYTTGAGTNVLTFTYTVSAGDTTSGARLDEASAGALTLNGGTIKDTVPNNPNPANLTVPAPATAGSLRANKNIVIDAIAPTATNITSSTGNGTYGPGTPINVTFTFSKAVNVVGTPQLALNSGGTANYV